MRDRKKIYAIADASLMVFAYTYNGILLILNAHIAPMNYALVALLKR